jgi:hypothetical protein
MPLSLHNRSHELSPASDKHTHQHRHKPVIGLSDPPLCRCEQQTNPDRNHRIDRRHQAAARARSGACHHTPAESLIIILSLLQQPYHLYRCSSSLFTYIISLLPAFTTHTLPSSFLLHYTPHLYISKMVAPPDGGQLERVESYQVGTDDRGAPPCHHRFQL